MQIFDLFGTVSIEGVEQGANQMMFLGDKITSVGNSLYGFGQSLYSGITKPLVGLIEQGVKYNSSMEDLKASFEVMLGSVEKAEQMTQRLIDMGARTPFDSMQLAEYTKTMLAFGYTENNVIEIMGRLGDISLGNNEKMQSLTRTMGQINSLGKLQGGDLNQLIGQGWNPLNEITKKTGESMEKVRKRMSDGKIAYKEVELALISATSAGGQFFGGMEKGSQTLSGRISTLRDNFMSFLGDAVKPISDFIANTVVPKLIEWADKLKNLTSEQKLLMLVVAGIVAIIPPLIMAFGGIVTAIGVVVTAIGAVISAISTIGAPLIIVAGLLTAFAAASAIVYAGIVALAFKLGILQGAFDYLKSAVMVVVAIFKGDVAGAFDILTVKFGMTGNNAANFIVKVIELKEQAIILGTKIKDTAANLIDHLGKALLTVASWIYNHRAEIMALIGVLISFGTTVIQVGGWTIDKFNGMLSAINANLQLLRTFKNIAIDAFNAAKNAASNLIDMIGRIRLPKMSELLPYFAEGVQNFSGGYAIVGERGPELVELPKGSNVYSNQDTRNMVGKPKAIEMSQETKQEIFNFNGNIVIDAKNIKDFNDIINVFKNLRVESVTRGGVI